MKKFLVIVILLSYSVASFGVSLNYFYCCGKLKSVSLFPKVKKMPCSMRSGKGCCDNRTVVYQLKTDQNNPINYTCAFDQPIALPANTITAASIHSLPSIFLATPLNNGPPPGTPPSLQVLYCTFRI